MKRIDLVKRVKARRTKLEMTIENLASLSGLGFRTVTRFFAGDDVKLSSVEQITQVLGLDFAGNEEIDIQRLREARALERAIYIMSLVQDTSALEGQGLDKEQLDELIEKTKQELLTGEYKDKLWSS